MDICKKCGECCLTFETKLGANEHSASMVMAMQKMLGIKFKDVTYVSLKAKALCEKYDTTKKSCIDYKNRPAACRNYYCGRYQDGEEVGKTNP